MKSCALQVKENSYKIRNGEDYYGICLHSLVTLYKKNIQILEALQIRAAKFISNDNFNLFQGYSYDAGLRMAYIGREKMD